MRLQQSAALQCPGPETSSPHITWSQPAARELSEPSPSVSHHSLSQQQQSESCDGGTKPNLSCRHAELQAALNFT